MYQLNKQTIYQKLFLQKFYFLKKKIYINLVRSIIFIKYNNSKYDLFLIDNTMLINTKVFFKNKN